MVVLREVMEELYLKHGELLGDNISIYVYDNTGEEIFWLDGVAGAGDYELDDLFQSLAIVDKLEFVDDLYQCDEDDYLKEAYSITLKESKI